MKPISKIQMNLKLKMHIVVNPLPEQEINLKTYKPNKRSEIHAQRKSRKPYSEKDKPNA